MGIDLRKVSRKSGVYALCKGVECIYVGSSKCLRDRLRSNKHTLAADWVQCYEVPVKDLAEAESRLIGNLKPTLNRTSLVPPRADLSPAKGRFSIALDSQDQQMVDDVQEYLRKRGLRLSRSAAVRYALRQAVANLAPPKEK